MAIYTPAAQHIAEHANAIGRPARNDIGGIAFWETLQTDVRNGSHDRRYRLKLLNIGSTSGIVEYRRRRIYLEYHHESGMWAVEDITH